LNSRLDELQAAILRVKLTRLDEEITERRAIASRYGAALSGLGLEPPRTAADAAHAYHLFVVRAGDRADRIARLEARGIGHGIHYPDPVHLMEAYRFLGGRSGDLPVTETACREVLSLPLYPGLSDASVARVLEALAAGR
jgi:dTDP-4-amino-4,6-dideoxygalactose transaminase